MSLTTLDTIVAAVQDLVGALEGVRMAPDIPPEQIAGGSVWAAVYPANGTITGISAGRQQGEHTLHIMVATAERNLRSDWARIISYGTTVPNAILGSSTLGGAVLQANTLRYSFGQIEWGGQQMIGWTFEADILTTGSID